MSTPYRNEIEALRERKAALEQETNRLREQKVQLDWLSAREEEIQRELSAIDARLQRGQRRLPLLDQVSVASPCPAKWDEMVGDDRTRFCLSCDKNVYNISALPREEAEQFLQERASADVCVRYYQRADGTIMTSDCAVGVKRKRRKKAVLAIAGAGAMAFGLTTYMSSRAVVGKMEMPTTESPQTVTTSDPGNPGQWVAGGLGAMPIPTTPPVTTETAPQPKAVPPVPSTEQPKHVVGRMQMRR